MKRVIAHAIGRGATHMHTYAQMRQQYIELVTTADLSQSHWSVEFPDAVASVASLANGWPDDQKVGLAIRDAESDEQLTERLAAAGVAMDFDPDECSHNNNALASKPKSNQAYWARKILSNQERDRRTLASLRDAGWSVLELWESEIRAGRGLIERIVDFMQA